MLSLNNKYFIGSIYAGMLWSLGDVTEPFHVNFSDVQKNLYRLLLCRLLRAGAGPDKIFLRERAGVGQNLAGGSGTEKSVLRRSLVQFYVFFTFFMSY